MPKSFASHYASNHAYEGARAGRWIALSICAFLFSVHAWGGWPQRYFKYSYYLSYISANCDDSIGRWFIKGDKDAYYENGTPKAKFTKNGIKWYFCGSAESKEEFEDVELRCDKNTSGNRNQFLHGLYLSPEHME